MAPRVAWLSPEGVPVDEDGEVLEWDAWPERTRLYCSWDTAYQLVRAGEGEALCWNGEEIRWRHAPPRGGDGEWGWREQATDAFVVRFPFDEGEGEKIVRALTGWRDWLAEYGAAPKSMGSAAWSLLRATLTERVWTRVGNLPPLKFTNGGRIENGARGAGTYTGRLAHFDLPAAYASTLGGLRYGGRWQRVGLDRHPSWWAASGLPVFVRARVTLPRDGLYGLLLRRPRRQGYLAGLLQASYPVEGRVQGVWTWQELELAETHGARLQLLECWAHRARPSQTPFAAWWVAVQAGRELGGLAGSLAKMTGNALVGRLAMDPAAHGTRSVRSRKGGKGRLVDRRLGQRPARVPDHALTETVTGRVRAQLTAAMLAAGDDVICAHTDGLWISERSEHERGVVSRDDVDGGVSGLGDRVPDDRGNNRARQKVARGRLPGSSDQEGSDGPETWRRDKAARRIDLVQPMILRWRPPRGEDRVVFAGVPAGMAGEAFERVWNRMTSDTDGRITA